MGYKARFKVWRGDDRDGIGGIAPCGELLPERDPVVRG